MKKLRLELDALLVETFEPQARAGARRGTVAGNAMVWVSFGCVVTENGCESWDVCPDTKLCLDTGWEQCGYSYGGTCGASPPILDGQAAYGGDFVDPALCM
jgi:hypothetical protein